MDVVSILFGNTGVIVKKYGGIVLSLVKGWKWLSETEVLVGIPEEKSAREGPLTNAQLMYLHTNGVPSHNIPARPVIEPALMQDDVRSRIEDYLNEGMKAALKGDIPTAQRDYELAGMIGANAAVDYFTSGNLAPNAPSTIAKKGSSQPLIDTGQLRKSITYVVRKK